MSMPESLVKTPKMKKRITQRKKINWAQNTPLLLMFIPGFLFFALFKYAPMYGLTIAFKDYNFSLGIMGSPWVGLKHFEMLYHNPGAIVIIRNTLVIGLLTIIVGFPFPIILAILLNEVKSKVYKRTVQTMVYLPHFFSWVIVGGMVVTLFSQESSLINGLLQKWTGDTFAFLYNQNSWLAIFLGSGIWKEFGWGAIIYLAALSGINPELYEASSLDGATKWKQIRYITLPGISNMIVMMLILNVGHFMEIGFDQMYVLQNAAVDISEVISTWIYKMGIQSGQFSLTTAMGLFDSLIGLILVVSANAIAKKYDRQLW